MDRNHRKQLKERTISLMYFRLNDKDKGMTPEEKRLSRIRATKKEAQKFIDKNLEIGRYA